MAAHLCHSQLGHPTSFEPPPVILKHQLLPYQVNPLDLGARAKLLPTDYMLTASPTGALRSDVPLLISSLGLLTPSTYLLESLRRAKAPQPLVLVPNMGI